MPSNDDDTPAEPVTPAKPAVKRDGSAPSTPKSAPAATTSTSTDGTPTTTRPRSNSKKPLEPPTLLTDFFKGRPSPARIAAERERRKSLEAMKAEMRHEMRQSAVRRVQPPGGVRDRVKAWQKANATAAVNNSSEQAVDDAATEPTDVAFDGEDFVSVTEEDRVRIKMRQKKKNNGLKVKSPDEAKAATQAGEDKGTDSDGSKPPPKKRVVSDEHWRERRSSPRRLSPTRRVSPKMRSSPSGGARIPKDFTTQSAPNPNVSNKIKTWAAKVEIPDTAPPRSYRSSKSREASSARSEGAETEREVLSEAGSRGSSQNTARLSRRVKSDRGDDGIRIKPVRKKKLVDGDGIRIIPSDPGTDDNSSRSRSRSVSRSAEKSAARYDDGIRVRPVSAATTGKTLQAKATKNRSRERSKTLPSEAPTSSVDDIIIIEESELSQTTARTKETRSSRSDDIVVTEDPESVVDTPTKRKPSKSRPSVKERERPKSYHARSRTREDSSWIEDGKSTVGASQLLGSDLSSSIANKSVADIPGEIPFGHSAFSELDLPLDGGVGRSRPKRMPKPERNSSLPGVGVFKKVMEEGKKIIYDINEPPRPPAANNPPSIEKWLNNTVDPFVDESKTADSTPAKPAPSPSNDHIKASTPEMYASREKETPAHTHSRKPSTHESKPSRRSSPKAEATPSPPKSPRSAEKSELSEATTAETAANEKTPDSPGLKRRRATRSQSSPIKAGGKRPFLGMLKEAFQGESGGYKKPSISYQSHEERRYDDDDDEHYDDDDDDDYSEDRTVTSGYDSRLSSAYDDARTRSDLSADVAEPTTPRMAGPRFRPPTSGNHELSTILSEESSSAVESDMTSDVSQSTLTQSTTLTKASERSRSKSGNHAPGLKRRLTKHSDLMSVLSLPDDKNIPTAIRSSRSRPSLRKQRGGTEGVTGEELLMEFLDDEELYSRELKTLVDGVVPVLLKHVVQDDSTPPDLFNSTSPDQSKSVVSMGVALEKLRNAHRKAPHSDIRKLANWAHGVVPIYNSYIGAWRLGFQDLVVNLAPAAGVPEDEDSLLNAMPRNEHGDIVNEDGERVDVAHLLKRPLIRVKHLVKLLRCLSSIIPSEETHELLRNFEELQEKSRHRFRQETARITDEDAINTDTTRCRDLRTLGATDHVSISANRQVNAKDLFSLDLAHSSGQRLECQVELVHRDNTKSPEDPGDILIRETGDGGRAYLLFPPLPLTFISARTGDGNNDMVVMIRGTYRGRQWHELVTLSAESEDQILDWLDLLPIDPIPPREPEPSVVGDESDEESAPRVDIPVGARSIRRRRRQSSREETASPQSPPTPKRDLPLRYHPRGPPPSSKPSTIFEESEVSTTFSHENEKTPTRNDYGMGARQSRYETERDSHRSRPLSEGMRPDPQHLVQKERSNASARDDGAPPPPIHRTFSVSSQQQPEPQNQNQNQNSPSIKPPVELRSDGKIRRRTSSPLKHEYLPSDGSEGSEPSELSYSEESDSYSSEDEMDSLDLPETELGVSIKHGSQAAGDDINVAPLPEPIQTGMGAADSECSLTPSNSASQAGVQGATPAPEEEPAQRFMASISRWSDRGVWKDIADAPCTILVMPGLIEAYPILKSGAMREGQPMLAMDLTPLVLIRQSTTVDLEIRSAVQPHCQIFKTLGGGNFRFRCHNGPDCYNLYMAVHHSRLNNQKFIQLENEARFRSFGERPAPADNDADSSTRRRSWFGRKNSYRSSVRAPSQSQSQSQDGVSTNASSSVSATSFLKRLSAAGNLTFNLARSSVDKQGGGSGRNSLYSLGSSSASGTPPRSPSISIGGDGSNGSISNFNSDNIRIRLHLLTTSARWEDYGNCTLQIRRPPPGWHQALRADHGLEKRITVTTIPRKQTAQPKMLLDAVLGSGCFSGMGSRGIVCGVWEEVRDGKGVVGMVPETGATGGNIKKWCFQCASSAEASFVMRLVHQEVVWA